MPASYRNRVATTQATTMLVGETMHLKNGDVIELAGTQMQFVQA